MTNKLQTLSIEQPDFIYFECRDCGFDTVQSITYTGTNECPLCAIYPHLHPNGLMTKRTARDTDDPEGHDARK